MRHPLLCSVKAQPIVIQHTFDIVLHTNGHVLPAGVERPIGADSECIELKGPEPLPVLAKEIIEADVGNDAGVTAVATGHESVQLSDVGVMIRQVIDGPVHDNSLLNALRQIRYGPAFNEVTQKITGLEVGIEIRQGEVGEEVQVDGSFT